MFSKYAAWGAAAVAAVTPSASGVLSSSDNDAPRATLDRGKSFVGPADDPFFVDLGATFDGINFDNPDRRAWPSTEPRALTVSSPLINEVIIPIGQKDKYGS